MFWADEFKDIPAALADNAALRDRVTTLICNRRMPGKVTEGAGRLAVVRSILCDFVSGKIALREAIHRVELECPQRNSHYSADRRVFCEGWAQRLVRTQLSRFYSQAVLELLREHGYSDCLVPHSAEEDAGSQCTQFLAGRPQSVDRMLQRLEESYEQGYWNTDPKVPDHPHCTHVVRPLPAAETMLNSMLLLGVAG